MWVDFAILLHAHRRHGRLVCKLLRHTVGSGIRRVFIHVHTALHWNTDGLLKLVHGLQQYFNRVRVYMVEK